VRHYEALEPGKNKIGQRLRKIAAQQVIDWTEQNYLSSDAKPHWLT
jgi:hypothetical protein